MGLQGDETHGKLASVLYDGNASWASDAPVLMLSVPWTFGFGQIAGLLAGAGDTGAQPGP